MKKIYYISFYNTKKDICDTFIKAKDTKNAEQKFYKKYPYYLIRKISLL